MNYLNKDEQLRSHLDWFIVDQTQLGKVFRRDVDELKRTQHEHMSKLDRHMNTLPFDEFVQQHIEKYYHYRHFEEDDDDDDDDDDDIKLNRILASTIESDKMHDEHVLWLKKKKKDVKNMASNIEHLRTYDC
jgi:hypothetical protein